MLILCLEWAQELARWQCRAVFSLVTVSLGRPPGASQYLGLVIYKMGIA